MSDQAKGVLAYLISCGVLAVAGGLLAFGFGYLFAEGAAIGLGVGLLLASIVVGD